MRILTFISLSLLLWLPAHSAEDWLTFDQSLKKYNSGARDLQRGLQALGLGKGNTQTSDKESARSFLKPSSDAGNPIACLLLARITPEAEERIRLLRIAVDKRLQAAVYSLADQLYQHGKGDSADYPEALRLFETANQWQHKDAEFYTARMYHFGHGTDIDYQQARHYYASAIEHGSIRAANNLSNLYVSGKGGSKDFKKAVELLAFASDNGMAMASENLGLHYRTKVKNAPDWKNAEIYYERAVKQLPDHFPEAAYQVGRIAEFAYASESPNFERATHFYTISADLGNAKAACRLGYIYRDGIHIEQDLKIAWDYFEISSNKDFPRALFAQARMIETGQFGVPDYQKAIPYYRRASDLGHIQATANLAWILWETAPIAEENTIHTLSKKAVKEGNTDAIVNYGYINLYEKIGNSDPGYGLELTLKLAKKNECQAIKNLYYYYQGYDDLRKPDSKQAKYWKKKLDQHTEK
jgi:TPR repeat protein